MKLTKRETEVIELVCQGKTDKELCRETGLASGTLRNMLRVVCAKLDANNRTAAAVNYTRIKYQNEETG